MEDPLGSYSDGRTVAPMAHCPRCGSASLHSRDATGGLEIACATTGLCGHRVVLTSDAWAAEGFDQWIRSRRSPGEP